VLTHSYTEPPAEAAATPVKADPSPAKLVAVKAPELELKAKLDPLLGPRSPVATGTPTAITIADESSDTTCFPLFVTAATGDLGPKSGSNLAFNSSSGALTATSFAGDGSALTGVAAASAGGSVYECVNTISSNYTMTTNSNGVSAGPITVSATVTIPSGSSWSIV
jgi:hypothetical protein